MDMPAHIAEMQRLQSPGLAVPPADRLAGRALVVLAGLHLVLALAFALSLASAGAVLAQATCGGENLVERLRRDDPKRFATVMDEAARISNGTAVLWKVSKPGLEPSFLFGTMHSADPRVAVLPPAVDAAFATSRTVLVEATETLDPNDMAAAIVALKHLTLLDDGTTLENHVPEELHAPLRRIVESHGLPWQAARLMQPWMIAAAVAIPACETDAKRAGAVVLDTVVGRRATADGKDLVGLETVEEQFTAIASVSRDFHVSALVETLSMGDLAEAVMETTKLLYIEGNTALMLPLIRAFAPKTYSGPAYREFRERLIGDRNVTMAGRAAPYLGKGAAFIAVGALHLPGERGLVALLRKQGFTVEAVALR